MSKYVEFKFCELPDTPYGFDRKKFEEKDPIQIKLYKDNKRNEKKINVSFFQDTLIRIVQEKYPQCGNFGEVLIDIRKRKPAYLHETPNIKCRTVEDEEQNTISGCRLILDELPISEETKDAFRQMLSQRAK